MPHLTPSATPPRPIVLAALALMAGTAAGFAFPGDAMMLFSCGVGCLGWGGWALWRSRRVHGPASGRGLALLAALALIGWGEASRIATEDRLALEAFAPWAAERIVCVEGVVRGEPQAAADRVEVVLEKATVAPLRVGAAPGRLGLAVAVTAAEGAAAGLNAHPEALPLAGQRVRAWGRLRPVASPTTPNPFDPERAALGRGIGGRLTVTRPGDLEFGPRPEGLGAAWRNGLRNARRWIADVLRERLPAEQVPMARALLLGEAHLVPQPERDAYALTGLAHLLAVSGLNTAFVLLIFVVCTRLMGLSPRAAAWAGIWGVMAYAALTGFEPPVTRAAVMGAFILGGYLLRRVTTPLASIGAAAFLTLALDPRNLARVDWQLSYGCVASIILLTTPLHDLLSRLIRHEAAPGEPRVPAGWTRWAIDRFLLLPLAGLAAVHLGILPLQIEIFRQYNLLSPLYNLVCCGWSLLAMLGAMLTALLGWIPGVGELIAWPARGGLWSLGWMVRQMAAVPHMSLSLTPLSAPLMMLYYAALLGGGWLRSGEESDGRLSRKQAMSLVIRVGALLALVVWSQALLGARPDGREMALYMLDVGQGDAIVTRFPNGKVMVVDAGPAQGASDRGRQTVGPFLKTLGVSAIDCLAASHADADHIGGMAYLLERFDVKLMLEGPDSADSEVYRAMRRAEAERKVRTQLAAAGAALGGFEPARVRLLGPVDEMSDNNGSVVLMLEYGEVQILLTGDLEADGERKIIEQGLAEDIEVLKLGHHGSRSSTSEAFLKAMRPEAALISVGRNNRYGHPSPEVLRRLADEGITAFRTDNLGAVWVRTDGRRVRVYRYAGP